jgi:hypothetical protein
MPEPTIAVPVTTLLRIQRKLVFAVIFHLVGGLFLVALATGQFSTDTSAPPVLTPSQQANRDNLEHTNACLLGGNNKPADCPKAPGR